MLEPIHPPICPDCNHINEFFCAISKENDGNICEQETSKSYKKGEVVFNEGKYPAGVHILTQGKIKIVKFGEEGKEQIVRFAKKGDLLGYRSILGNHVYRASAIAICDIKVCHIPEGVFLKILNDNQWLYVKLLYKLSNDLALAEDMILSISQKPVKERVAEAIINLYHEFGLDNFDNLNVNLTRKEIGNIAGTTIETTIRTLAGLKKDNYIDFKGKNIIILDIMKLIKLAHYNSI